MKTRPPNAYHFIHYAKMIPFWEYKEVKLMQLNGLQTPSSPSSQTSFSPSSDAHPERKNQPVALISVAVRSKYAQGSFRTTLRQHFLSELRVYADAVVRSNANCLISSFLFSWRCRYFKFAHGLREPRHDARRSK